MLIESTQKMIDVIFQTDPTLKPELKTRVVAILSGREKPVKIIESPIMTRLEAAQYMKITPHRVDDYCRRGIIRRVMFPGSVKRSSGVYRSDVEAAVMGSVK